MGNLKGKFTRFFVITVLLLFAVTCRPLFAGTLWYEFSFTGDDLMRANYVEGADGTTAAENGLFDGARLQRRDDARTYVKSQHDAFNNWKDNTQDRFLSFNIWGFDGRGAHWGEDFKPKEWGTTTQPAGWTNWTEPWPWGDPPDGYYTDLLLGWDADSLNEGLSFNDTDLAEKVFSFQVAFDSEDMFWGQDTSGAPNTLPELTFWFGGYFDDDLWGDENNYYIYEGNMVLTGKQIDAPVPEPATMLLLGTGLIGLAGARVRKKIKI